MRVFALVSAVAAWSGAFHKKGLHSMKLRSHHEEYGLRSTRGHRSDHRAHATLHTKSARNTKAHQFKTSLAGLETHDFFSLGPGRCVYQGGASIPSTDYLHIAGATEFETCRDACTNNADCKGAYVDPYGCFLFLNDKRQLRAPAAGSVDKSSPSCWVKSRTYALTYPFYGVYGSALQFQHCVEVNDLASSIELPEYIDASRSLSLSFQMSVERCGVACVPNAQFAGHFFVGDDRCFCGDVSNLGNVVDVGNCGALNDTMMAPHYPGTPTVYAQYSAEYPHLNDDCPDGDRNLPSRYIVSGAVLGDPRDWTLVKLNLTLGDGCSYLCAGACNAHGASCHGYACKSQAGTAHSWFSGEINEDTWAGDVASCYLAVHTLPIVGRQMVAESQWLQSTVVCARRDCLERTVCASKDFHRVSGYVPVDSADLLQQVTVSNCADCADACLAKANCFTYQCSESLATAVPDSTSNCLLFQSYDPEGRHAFNVTDVAVCRRLSSDKCSVTDGVTPVGEESCACGATTCLGSKHDVSMACYINSDHPVGTCIEVVSGCPEGEVMKSTECTCVLQLECEGDPSCVVAPVAGDGMCPPLAPPSCVGTDSCTDAPLAKHCVKCAYPAKEQTVESNCAALCLAESLKATCPDADITSGECGFPNACHTDPPPTADDIVCGSDGKEYSSECYLNTVSGVSLARKGKCVTGCTKVGDTDCLCGGASGEHCDASTAEYCSDPVSGTCVTVCDPQNPSETKCICPTGAGMGNATYCNDHGGDTTSFCAPISTLAGAGTTTPTEGCTHDEGCVLGCAALSTTQQISKSCLCDDAFCCHNEVCATDGSAAQCMPVCSKVGESECTCLSSGDSLTHCSASEGAWASDFTTPGTPCICAPFCTRDGQTDCLCRMDESSEDYCTGGKVCSTKSDGTGMCLVQCTEYGQTNCLCGSNPDKRQICDSTGSKPTYCTTLNGAEVLLDNDATVALEEEVCAPKCEDGHSDCFCTGTISASVPSPICITNADTYQFCDMGYYEPMCKDGCPDHQGTSTLPGSCQCGSDKTGAVGCTQGQYCNIVTDEAAQYAVCAAQKIPICGNNSDLSFLVGVSMTTERCVCSSSETQRERICESNTYCVAETGNCMADRIKPCSACTIVENSPCFCCDTFYSTHGGICHLGDVCMDASTCKASSPVPRCNKDMVTDCLCGRDETYCASGNVCKLDFAQQEPSTDKCSSTGTGKCQLATYGHCAPPPSPAPLPAPSPSPSPY